MKTEICLELIELEKQSYHLILLASINDNLARMILDTGASRTCFDINYLKQIDVADLSSNNDIQSSGLGGAIEESMVANIDSLQLGDFTIRDYKTIGLNLEAVNHAYSLVNISSIHGILGGDILKTFNSIIRYDKRILILKTRKPDYKSIYLK
jgi:hypothetical protein